MTVGGVLGTLGVGGIFGAMLGAGQALNENLTANAVVGHSLIGFVCGAILTFIFAVMILAGD